ncbi:MAG: PDDEXK nuclease domain-containing protein [Candidatus Woesearchaeota archaeon]
MILTNQNYNSLIENISSLLEQARKDVYYQVNQVLVQTYWKIGRDIIEYEQKGEEKAEYGSNLLENLSKDLTLKYGKGFSLSNLKNMRLFYQLFPVSTTLLSESARKAGGVYQFQKSQALPNQFQKSQALLGKSQVVSAESPKFKLSWTHYCELLKVKENLARSFYEKQSERENWSYRELRRQINSMLFERIALSKDKQGVLDLAKEGQIIEKPADVIKDPYILEFLGLEECEKYNESDIENKVISNLKNFILELGRDFLFVDRQKRITLANRHYYIDLVLYHRTLKCFVLIDLKLGEMTHSDTGQMSLYLNYYRQNEVREGENEPIGLILCASKNKELAKYILTDKQMFASEYKLKLPSEEVLQEQMKKLLQ